MFLSPWQATLVLVTAGWPGFPKEKEQRLKGLLKPWSRTDIVSLPARHHPSPPAMGRSAKDRGHVYSFVFFLIYIFGCAGS